MTGRDRLRDANQAGEVRQALREVIGRGLSGPAEALAALTGFPPESVRMALWNMRRSGEVASSDATPAMASGARSRGRPPRVYAAPRGRDFGPAQTLAYVQAVWR